MTFRVSELEPLEPAAPDKKLAWTLPPGVRFERGERGGRTETSSEINLIGATVEEALGRLDKFLDDAYLSGHSQVRIVHGHGTGRLRAAIRKMLTEHPHVESLAAAEERSGGTGATIATLRS